MFLQTGEILWLPAKQLLHQHQRLLPELGDQNQLEPALHLLNLLLHLAPVHGRIVQPEIEQELVGALARILPPSGPTRR